MREGGGGRVNERGRGREGGRGTTHEKMSSGREGEWVCRVVEEASDVTLPQGSCDALSCQPSLPTIPLLMRVWQK